MKQLTAFVLLFVLLYNPPFPVFPINLTYIVYLVGILYFLFKRRCVLLNTEVNIFLWFLLVVLWGCIITIVKGAYDFNMLGISRFFTGWLSSMAIVSLLNSRNKMLNVYLIVKFIVIASSIQSIIILLTFIYDPAKEFLLLLFRNMPELELEKITNLSLMRGLGWTYVQFADFAIVQGMGLFSLISLQFMDVATILNKKKYFSIFLLLHIIAGILIARTFLFLIILSVGYYFYLRSTNLKSLGMKFFIGVRIMFVVILLSIFTYNLAVQYFSKETVDWMFEAFKNYSDNGTLQTDSTEELKEYWHLPNNIFTLIFGDGRFVDDVNFNYAKSDSAYIIGIYYWGLIGSILYYTFIYKLYYYSRSQFSDTIMRSLLLVFFATIILYNVKGIFSGLVYFCLFLEASLVNKSKNILSNGYNSIIHI